MKPLSKKTRRENSLLSLSLLVHQRSPYFIFSGWFELSGTVAAGHKAVAPPCRRKR